MLWLTTTQRLASIRHEDCVYRAFVSGPKFFPANWCGSSSIDDRSSCHEDLVSPCWDDGEEQQLPQGRVQFSLPVADKDFDAMFEDFDQDALERQDEVLSDHPQAAPETPLREEVPLVADEAGKDELVADIEETKMTPRKNREKRKRSRSDVT